ncbi:MAG: hypothetical protein K0R25_1136 [Rickettsiaceae bacterium]|jgi:thiol-disulfide isomerase/thioredoxin|nr:hypothetical protein [Rickettsiaceae bacterium]
MTKKDKKLILFIISVVIVFWFSFLSISSLLSTISFHNSETSSLSEGNLKWINVSRNLSTSDLKNRVILLDFWTYACVNCMQMIPEVKKLEQEFGDKLLVVGVHSGKFDNEKEIENIKKAVLKYDISHPVVNDANFKIWKSFDVSAWPTLILLDPSGTVRKKYEGEVAASTISQDVKKLIEKYRGRLNNNKLPIALEKNKVIDLVLKFPSKIKLARDFSYQEISRTSALVISNTGKNSIIIVDLRGNVLLEIGSGVAGFEDGKIKEASFNSPRGILFKDNILYVADTGNHALRKIDFKRGEVTTIAGNGTRGGVISSEVKASEAALASPWDLEFFPDKKTIIIANAGTHQLLKYNIDSKSLTPFAGNGSEDLVDGKYPNNSLAQPSGLSAANDKLYFVDSESSSLRVVQKNGEVSTLIGKGLFDFGHENGDKNKALMQHPVGLTADDFGVYIADTHNHLIRKYSFSSNELSDFSGSVKGDGIGGKNDTNYNEPEAIISVLDKFYIADTNNNRIVELHENSGNSKLLNIEPKSKTLSESLVEYLPNLETVNAHSVKSDSPVTLIFDIKTGWKINDSAPSFLNLVEINSEKEASLIAAFDSAAIKSGSVQLPELSGQHIYYLQGSFYYCQDKENSICLIKNYEQKLEPKKFGSDKIKIEFIYQ